MDKDLTVAELTKRIEILEAVVRSLGCGWFIDVYIDNRKGEKWPTPSKKLIKKMGEGK